MSLAMFRNADAVPFPAGQCIFNCGEAGSEMYVIKSGSVEVQFENGESEKVGQGEIVGEMALLDDGTRSATAVAASDCELVPITAERFQFLVQQTPFFAIEVMRTMARRLRRENAS